MAGSKKRAVRGKRVDEIIRLLDGLKDRDLQLAEQGAFRALHQLLHKWKEAADWEATRRQQWWWEKPETGAQAKRRLDREGPALPKTKGNRKPEQEWVS